MTKAKVNQLITKAYLENLWRTSRIKQDPDTGEVFSPYTHNTAEDGLKNPNREGYESPKDWKESQT